ncbi:MAG: 50S ribosomal protein L9 [Actinomycetota bacterium]|nr:50S ribosomal protein L9 [Actinomycetota bacterium]
MQVILRQDVANLGRTGDVVGVADGYANNYLVPRGLAMRATRGAIKDAQVMRAARREREARTLGEAQELKARLEERPVEVPMMAGEDGTLYGSVGNTVVARAVADQLGVTVDRRRMPMERPLKQLGTHEVDVRLQPELSATLTVEVVRAQ